MSKQINSENRLLNIYIKNVKPTFDRILCLAKRRFKCNCFSMDANYFQWDLIRKMDLNEQSNFHNIIRKAIDIYGNACLFPYKEQREEERQSAETLAKNIVQDRQINFNNDALLKLLRIAWDTGAFPIIKIILDKVNPIEIPWYDRNWIIYEKILQEQIYDISQKSNKVYNYEQEYYQVKNHIFPPKCQEEIKHDSELKILDSLNNPTINNDTKINICKNSFIFACNSGNINFAQKLLPYVQSERVMYLGFKRAIITEQIKIIELLISKIPTKDILYEINYELENNRIKKNKEIILNLLKNESDKRTQ